MLRRKYPKFIYAIQHNVTGKVYIGSTTDIDSRYSGHISNLRNNRHSVEDMQYDFDVHGENYSVFILEKIEKAEDDNGNEYEWMKKYTSHKRGIGYNYKDNIFKKRENKLKVPIVDGTPETEVSVTKDKLHELIDTLTSNEVIYFYTFINKMIQAKEQT